jgi:hypothetical protein
MKAPNPKSPSDKSPRAVAGASKRLLLQRLREIDKLTARELARLKADSERLKQTITDKRTERKSFKKRGS